MGSPANMLSEELLECSLCLCVLTDPVCTPCGHSFCLNCISDYLDNSQQWHCPNCKEVFLNRPRLSINVVLSKLTGPLRRSGLERVVEIRKRPLDSRPHNTPTVPIAKRALLLLCILAVVIAYTTHICQDTSPSPSRLADLCDQKVGFQDTVMTAEDRNEKSTRLRQRSMQMAVTTMDKRLHNLSTMVTVLMRNVLATRMTLAKLEGLYNRGTALEKKMTWILQYAVDVTFDPDTAHPSLVISPDHKQVWQGQAQPNLSDNAKRFNYCVSVLGKEGFKSGRFYYKVQIRGKTAWDLGVARESVKRKGMVELGPLNGYWAIWLRNGSQYAALEKTVVPISLNHRPETVGVFVDYDKGLVSFYDGDRGTHIFSFTGVIFNETLYPYFSPNLSSGGKNSAPITIP